MSAICGENDIITPISASDENKRKELIQSMHENFVKALSHKKRSIPKTTLPLKITAQGGVGTAEEHQFLIDHYQSTQ